MLTNKWTNKPTELHQFRNESTYDGDLSPCQVWIRLDKPFSSQSPELEILTDRQTKNRQMNGRNYTNLERNPAVMVLYVPVTF